MPRSHRPGDSSESHVAVQNKFFPEASGPSLVLSARLGLTKEKKERGKKGGEQTQISYKKYLDGSNARYTDPGKEDGGKDPMF